MRKRAAFLLALTFVIACGGGSVSTTTATSATSAAVTTAATNAPATSAATSAKPSADADASAQLAATLGLAKNATYKITYKITVSGGGLDAVAGAQTWYFKPPRARFDFAMVEGGQTLTLSYFSLPEGTFYCFNVGAVQCRTVAGVGSPLDQNAVAVAQQSIIANAASVGATPSAGKTIAGQQATCFDVTSKGAATGFDSGTFCYSAQGVPLLSTFTTAHYATWTMEATAFSPTVADSDFTLPATPMSQ